MLSFSLAPTAACAVTRSTAAVCTSSTAGRSARALSSTPSSSAPRTDKPVFSRPSLSSSSSSSSSAPSVQARDALHSYPSPLGGQVPRYRKAQRRPWHGPESDHPSPVLEAPGRYEGVVVNPDHPLVALAQGAEIRPAEWFVHRTLVGDYLPVYQNLRAQGHKSKLTKIRHLEGNTQALLKSLLLYLAESNPEIKGGASGRVNPTTGDIELLGHWKKDVCEFLLARGM